VNAIFIAMPSLAANAGDVTAVSDAGKDAAKTSVLLDSFKRSGLMLGAIQGLVTATLSVFFVSKPANRPADPKQPQATKTPE